MRKKQSDRLFGIRRAVCMMAAAGALMLLSGCAMTGNAPTEAEQSDADSPQEELQQTSSEAENGAGGDEGEMEDGKTGGETDGEEISGLPDSWDFDRGSILLEDVLESLDQNGIRYTGYYNVSGERIDLTLEDGTAFLFLQRRNEAGETDGGYELMLKGTQFNRNGFQENYLGAYDVITDEPFYPDLSAEPVEESTLWSMNQTDLAIARNQIYARHGRKFQDPFLDALFRTKSWYEPLYDGAEFDAAGQEMLSETERQNLSQVLEIERIMHYSGGGGKGYETARALMSGSLVDLDGDGTWERVIYTRQMDTDNDIGFWDLRIYPEGKEEEQDAGAQMHLKTVSPHSNCYLASADGTHCQVILAADGFSDDPVCSFYQYGAGNLTQMGEITSGVWELEIRPEGITAPVEYQHFQCQPIRREYVTENGRLAAVEREYYEYAGNVATVNRQIPLLTERAGTQIGPVLEPGERVIVRGGDLREWVLLEKESTGEQGWLRVTDTDCHLPDGTTGFSAEWFEGLPFYG